MNSTTTKKPTLLEALREINTMVFELTLAEVARIKDENSKLNALVFFCQHGKFPDEV